MNILVVIPARGGSVGIPRKNLRNLNGQPLIAYSIRNALASKYDLDVYVSSDDEEILHIASKFGANKYKRDANISDSVTTLDPVIYDAYKNISKTNNKEYDLIITLQPTSPLLKVKSLDLAIEKMINHPEIDTIISAKDSTHLTWKKQNDKYVPNYKKRVNRQYLPPVFTETGGFLITRNTIISENNRIGDNTELFILSKGEDIDIDTYEEFNICEYFLCKKHILFVVSGYNEIGFGHIYRTLLLANNITNHRLTFLVDSNSKLGYEKIKDSKFDVYIQKNKNILDDISQINPDIVINDILDTNRDYILALKNNGIKVINFEDLGDGAKSADLVINALYPESESLNNHYFGYKYFCARDEFLVTKPKKVEKNVSNILISFGGTDPCNLTLKTLESIYEYCVDNDIEINVILGFGYNSKESLRKFPKAKIKVDIKTMSDFMHDADIIFTSVGRTVYEVACIGTPAILMAQNERELTHFFASKENGFVHLGLGKNVERKDILDVFTSLISNYEQRKMNNKLMLAKNLKNGTKNVIKLINKVISE